MFKMKAPKPQPAPAPPPPVPLPSEDDASVMARKKAAQREMRGRAGRRSTLLSGGALDEAGGGGYRALLS